MNKIKITIILLVLTTIVQAQRFGRHSLEMGYGKNKFKSDLVDGRTSDLVNVGYRYMITKKFGVQTFGQIEVVQSERGASKDVEFGSFSVTHRVELYQRLFNIDKLIFTNL